MKTLRKIAIRQTPFPKERIQAIEEAHRLEEKYADVKIECDYVVIPDFLSDAVLEDEDNLDESWIQRKLNKLQYHVVYLDMTRSEWKQLGLRRTLYGQAKKVYTRFGVQGITYGRWDSQIGAKHAAKMPAYLQPIHPLTVGVWHEDTHLFNFITKVLDITHHFFYGMWNGKRWQKTPQPEKAWSNIDFSKVSDPDHRRYMQIANLLDTVSNMYTKLASMTKTNETLLHPIEGYKNYVTQEYGVYKPEWYPQTSHHIGVDLACPLGTPLKAPYNGEITVAGYSDDMGYFCHYQYTYQGKRYTERYAHLQSQPKLGKYKRGMIVGRTGDTGFVTGPSLHWDIHKGDVDISSLNSSNFRSRTINPLKHYE